MAGSSTIRIAAAALIRSDGATLLVRKRGTLAFMQPGGKIGEQEEPVQALCRELVEELGFSIQPPVPEYAGCFTAPAANETGHTVVAEIFRVETDLTPTPAAEIEEICWVEPSAPIDLVLAPLTQDHVLPLVASWKQQDRSVP